MLERHPRAPPPEEVEPVTESPRRSAMKKQSLYFPEDMLREIMSHARRLDRSPSWVVQRAWMHARKVLALRPSVPQESEIVIRSSGDVREPTGG